MRISIITATYNSERTLRNTLDSVLTQDYHGYEHIIIDGGSTDNTLAIIREYEPSFAGHLRWISEPDHGIYDAMNKGIRMAKGEVVGILNSDDFYASNSVLSEIAKNIVDVDAVYGDLVFIDASDTSRIVRQWHGSQYQKGAFLKGWHPAHPTFYARKRLFDTLGAFDTTFKVSADFELMLRFFERGDITSRYIPMVFVKMRMGGESTGSIKRIIEGNRNVMRAFKKNSLPVSPLYPIRRLLPKAYNILKNKIGRRR